jgi:hypothetical protein
MGVVGFLVAAGTGVKGADSVQHDFSADCTKHMLSLSPCLDFVTGSLSGQPTEDCCSALDSVLAHEPGCLCLLFPIDLTLVVSLPAACNIITSQEICKDIPFTVSAYVPPKRESNPPNVNARSAKYSDTDSIETLTPIPGPDFFETPIPDTDSFEILVPTSPFGSANAKDNEGNGAGGLWEPLIRFWDLGMNYFS